MEHSIFHKVDIKQEDDQLNNHYDAEEDGGHGPGAPGEERIITGESYQEMFPGLPNEDPFASASEEKMCVKLDPSDVPELSGLSGHAREIFLDSLRKSATKKVELDPLSVGKTLTSLTKAVNKQQHLHFDKFKINGKGNGNGSAEISRAEDTATVRQDAGQDLVSKYCSKILHYCRLCKLSFPSVQINVQHWSIVHKETPMFFCRFKDCDFSSNSDEMRLHIIQHLVKTSKIVICDHCCVAQLPKQLLYHRRQCVVKGAVAEAEAEVSRSAGDGDVVSQMIEQIMMRGLPFKGHYKKLPPVLLYLNNCFNECTKCGTELDSSEELILHWQEEHKGDNFKVACRFNACSFESESQDSLKDHIMQHLVSVGKVVKCPSCSKLLKYDYIKAHVKQCTAEGKLETPVRQNLRGMLCHLCDKKFTTETLLVKHLEKEHHSDQYNTYSCEYCDKSFLTVKKLKAHTKNIHGRAKSYRCDICEKTFISIGGLNSHKFTHQNGKHSCEHCGKIFKTPHSFKVHVKTVHSTEFRYSCEKCDFKTNRNEQLKLHVMQKHDESLKPFMCELCEKKFATKQLLERHAETHLPDEEKYKFSCHCCPSMFTTKSNLNTHIKSHHKQ